MNKKQRLDQALVEIRRAYGENVVRPLGDTPTATTPHLSTGFVVLDQALSMGGLPKGHLSHLSGIPTSGAMTVACKTLAQAVGEAVVYIDLPNTFDVDYAARCGIDTANLLLVQPSTLEQALETLTALVDTATASLLVPDTHLANARLTITAINRLLSALRRSNCTLIVVERTATRLLADKAAVRLHFQRERWLRQRQDVAGYRTRVRILKNQWGRTGQTVRLVIGFSTVVRGDGA